MNRQIRTQVMDLNTIKGSAVGASLALIGIEQRGHVNKFGVTCTNSSGVIQGAAAAGVKLELYTHDPLELGTDPASSPYYIGAVDLASGDKSDVTNFDEPAGNFDLASVANFHRSPQLVYSCASVPDDGDSITIDGINFRFKDTPVLGTDVQRTGGDIDASFAALVTAINQFKLSAGTLAAYDSGTNKLTLSMREGGGGRTIDQLSMDQWYGDKPVIVGAGTLATHVTLDAQTQADVGYAGGDKLWVRELQTAGIEYGIIWLDYTPH